MRSVATHHFKSLPVKNRLLFALMFFVLLLPRVKAEDRAMEALIADSPIVVVATPILKNGRQPLGLTEEFIAIYGLDVRLVLVLKAENSLKAGDIIWTSLRRSALDERITFDSNKKLILFLRELPPAKPRGIPFFENTSFWFGVMEHTDGRQILIESAIAHMRR